MGDQWDDLEERLNQFGSTPQTKSKELLREYRYYLLFIASIFVLLAYFNPEFVQAETVDELPSNRFRVGDEPLPTRDWFKISKFTVYISAFGIILYHLYTFYQARYIK